MKLCSIVFVLVNLALIASALPSKIYYYTGGRSAPYKNGLMYMQYVQPRYRNVAAGAYSAPGTLAIGTYANPIDCDDEKHTETFAARVDMSQEKEITTSVAEAYLPPHESTEQHEQQSFGQRTEGSAEEQHSVEQEQPQEEQAPVEEEIEIESVQPQPEPQPEVIAVNRQDRTGGFEHHSEVEQVEEAEPEQYLPPTTTVSSYDNEVTVKSEVTTSLPPIAVVPVLQVAPQKPVVSKPNRPRILPALAPKKKIQVRLDADDEEEEQVYTHYNRVVPKPVYLPNRGAPAPPAVHEVSHGTNYAASQSSNKRKEQSSQVPQGQSFFPVYFGGDNGGSAIAIANSYSTGEGGSATSHAIAYGSPATSQLRHKKVHRAAAAPIRRQ